MTLTAWATTSCSSRAIRARSSATAMRAATLAVPLGLGRPLLGRLASPRVRSRRAKPTSQPTAKSIGMRNSSPRAWVGSLKTTTAAHDTTSARPTRLCRLSLRFPRSTAETMPAMEIDAWRRSAARRRRTTPH